MISHRIVSTPVLFALLAAAATTACGAAPQGDGTDTSGDELRTRTIAAHVSETDLVSDQPGAATLDANLVNAWGLAFNPAGPAWIANNHSGTSTVYDAAGALKLTVTLPAATGSTDPSSPTGQVFNGGAAFQGDKFIFDGEDGRLYGWQPKGGVSVRGDFSSTNAIYKGLAVVGSDASARLYATDFHNGKVDVFDATYQPTSVDGGFTDSNIPAGYAPFNVQALGDNLYVTFAKQDANAEDDDHGAGRGYVDAFDFEGHLVRRIATRGSLNSPWGLAIAPASFGSIAGMLLVGNFGDGRINVYDFSGKKAVNKGALGDASGKPLAIDGLWAVATGPDAKLYFTAGPGGESHGLYGRLDVAAAPVTTPSPY